MPELVVVIPSRGRPKKAAEVVSACEATKTDDTEVIVAIDHNEPLRLQYEEELEPWGRPLHISPRSSHVGAINSAASEACYWGAFAVAKLDDDHFPRTFGWDSLFLDALHDMKTGIVYGNDLHQGVRLPTAPAMTADIIYTLGYMGPPELTHLYVDDFWLNLGLLANCIRYLPEVVIEHMHPHAGKASMDVGYRRVNSPWQYDHDGSAYQQYKESRQQSDVEKIQELCREGLRYS